MNEITKNVLIEFINKNENIVNFGTPEDAVDESWILKAEKYLGFPLTTSYKWFLREYRGGEICGEEIYSIYGLDFESVNGGDIVYHHIIDMKNNIIKTHNLLLAKQILVMCIILIILNLIMGNVQYTLCSHLLNVSFMLLIFMNFYIKELKIIYKL